ncbi:hypothetical protein KIN20_004253 [Parelaphostrongylus tenuis]|uniref:Uncharacterized protein n=1 Tax=Parelaphostrongylus tenuis TaxID=148309 RepID=A0AAD5M0D5_PARTN|nr:hypothetical protein KIN20_004253 [Parelaphostrongylus tenuis]
MMPIKVGETFWCTIRLYFLQYRAVLDNNSLATHTRMALGENAIEEARKVTDVLEEGSHRAGLFPTVIPAILSRLSVENNYNLLHSTEAEANPMGKTMCSCPMLIHMSNPSGD